MIVEAAVRKAFGVHHTGTVAGYHVLNSSRFCSLYPFLLLTFPVPRVSFEIHRASQLEMDVGNGSTLGSSEAGKAFRLQTWREMGG